MAKMTMQPCIEACRAAALASHSAAGLVTSVRKMAGQDAVQFGEVARLLRSSEALARAAVAALMGMASQAGANSPVRKDGAEAAGHPAGAAKAKQRRRKKKGSEAEVLPFMDVAPQMEVETACAVPTQAQTVPALATFGSSASSAALGGAESRPFFPVGSMVVLHGLASRKDLEGKIGSVIVAPSSAEDRVAIQFPGGEKVRVKHQNIKPSLFMGGVG